MHNTDTTPTTIEQHNRALCARSGHPATARRVTTGREQAGIDEPSGPLYCIACGEDVETARVAIEATCAVCGDQIVVPADEDPADTLCVACATDEQEGDER